MSTRMEAGLRTLVLALYDEAALTATAKGLTGALGQMAALRETASLACGPAHRPVSEEEVMRVLLSVRRTRRSILLPPDIPSSHVLSSHVLSSDALASDGALPSLPASSLRLRRGRLAARAMRSLARYGTAALV